MGNPKGEERRRVLLLCGDYMEDYEAMVPFQALQAFGVSVDAVSPGKKAGDICATAITIQVESTDQANSESRGHNFTLNATFDEIEFDEYDGLVIPGGRSPEHLAMKASVVELARKFSDSRKPIAAICHGLLVLAPAGAVKGRRCTAVSTMKPGLVAAGAHWVEPDTLSMCVADDNLITGVTYYGNPEFIGLFLKALGGNICASERRVLIIIGNYAEDYEVTVQNSNSRKRTRINENGKSSKCDLRRDQIWHFRHCVGAFRIHPEKRPKQWRSLEERPTIY